MRTTTVWLNSSCEGIGSHGDVEFRKATIGDAARLSAFAAVTFYETFVGTATEEDLQAAIRDAYGVFQQTQEIADPRASIILAERMGELVGFAHFTVEDVFSVELNRIYVADAEKGAGLARRLLGEVFDACRGRRAQRLWLAVWHANGRAIAFYEKHGFQKVGEVTFAWGSGDERGHVMERLGPF